MLVPLVISTNPNIARTGRFHRLITRSRISLARRIDRALLRLRNHRLPLTLGHYRGF